MKVKELIALLLKYDRNAKVMLTTYSDELYEEVGQERLLIADGTVVIEPKAQ